MDDSSYFVTTLVATREQYASLKRWESLPRVNLLKICQYVSTIGKTLVKAILMEGHDCSLKTDLGQKFAKKLESRFF